MKLRTWLALGALCLSLSVSAFAQHEQHGQQQMSAKEKAMMEAWQKAMTPGAQHKALDGMVGTWDTKVTSWMAPGAPPLESTGVSESRWVLGGRWIEHKFNGSFMNMPFEGIGYTGYDNLKKEFVSTWMDNMSTGAMVSAGSAAKDGKTMDFKSEMIDPMSGKKMPVKEKITVVDADNHVMEMWNPGPDGKMYKSMEIKYSRKK
jgi:hypothetical protein